jgi:glycosyltransferase involved in cell wall biosynthesis
VKQTFIAWIPYHRRSELLAQHLGATMHFIWSGRKGRLLRPPLQYFAQGLSAASRYPVQARQTWRVLRQEQPDVIFVQNPPIFSVLVVYLYARLHGARYVIDSHTGAFLSQKWRWSVGLHRMLSRQALLTIVHNKSQAEVVGRWGCRYCVLAFIPADYPVGEPFPLDGQFNVAMISSFNSDEPHDVVFGAAKRLPEVKIYVTGDSTLAPDLVTKKPDNCSLTGYLAYDRYVGLLRGVDAIMVLTTGDQQLLMGGFEAVSLGKPLIVSDWPLLREYFCLGTVYAPNTVEGICEGIRQAQRDLAVLQQEILILREQLQTQWVRVLAELQ